MRALVHHAPGDFRCETVPDPTLEAPGDAVVRVELAAVCGSDLHVWRGNEVGLDEGCVVGHEFLGEVVEVGAEVRGVAVGDRVVSPFTTSCGSCPACRSGLTSRCESGQLFGWVERGRGLHGVQAEYVRVPLADSTLVRLDAGMPAEESLLVGDVLATGFFCADAARLAPGSLVVVLGCGPVGLMAIAGARELGAGRVLAVDSVSERLALARRFGAEPVELDEHAAGARADVLEASGGRGADAVLEVVGSPAATRLAIDLLRPGGTISAVGVHTEASFAFTPGEAYDKNLTYVAGRCPARHYMPAMLELVRSARHPLGSLFSHRLPLEEGPRGYEIFDQKREGCTKVLLVP